MNIHEYQGKEIYRSMGVNVPKGDVALTLEEAVEVAYTCDAAVYVVKAQCYAGVRGKAGCVKIANSVDEDKEYDIELLVYVLVSHQHGTEGTEITRLLIEEG